MKLAATRSPKFRRLMNSTGMGRAQAVGTLELLWLFTMEQAPAGDVGRWDDADIEAELDWQGEPGALVEALVAAGWVDRCARHRLVVHDWAEHLPEFLARRVSRGQLVVAVVEPERDLSGTVGTSPDTARPVTVSQAKPSQEKPSQEPEDASRQRAPAFSDDDDGTWLLPQLRLNAKSTAAERACWLEARFGEIAAAARIDAETKGGAVRDHGVKIASARWLTYLKERDPTKRDFAREASAREKRAVRAAAREAEAADARASPPRSDDPIADLLPFHTAIREVSA